jgi:hypothetical protein
MTNRIEDHIKKIKDMFKGKEDIDDAKIEELADQISRVSEEDGIMLTISGRDVAEIGDQLSTHVNKTMEEKFEGETVTITVKLTRKVSVYHKTIELMAKHSNKTKEQLLGECLEVGIAKLAVYFMKTLRDVQEKSMGREGGDD